MWTPIRRANWTGAMAPVRRHDDEVEVDESLVRRLLEVQFPQWAALDLSLVSPSGTDHTIYRLGKQLLVRMPIAAHAAHQAIREARSVPFLAPQVPLELPVPVGLGQPGDGYPWNWSIVSWIDGSHANRHNLAVPGAAVDLARFIRALHACDPTEGLEPGESTALRGMPFAVWHGRLDRWIDKLDGLYDVTDALAVLHEAFDAPEWDEPPVWLHGDLAGNLICRNGRLAGVIDSGYAVGDPACDLMPGWILFRGVARRRFFDEVGLDQATVARARGWAVAPALIGLSYSAAPAAPGHTSPLRERPCVHRGSTRRMTVTTDANGDAPRGASGRGDVSEGFGSVGVPFPSEKLVVVCCQPFVAWRARKAATLTRFEQLVPQ